MKRILFSLLVVIVTAFLALGISRAFFSDTETSSDNTLQAGELDLEIDNESYYNGLLNQSTTWNLENLTDHLFFNFDDIKPDDYGEDTISLHADNDYWACMEMKVTKDDDNTCTEPEKLVDPNCDVPESEPNANNFDGELGGLVNFVWWVDDGDNVLEVGEESFINISSASASLNQSITLADSNTNLFEDKGPLLASHIYYIGKAWCFGTLGLAPDDQDGFGDVKTPAGDNNDNQTPGEPEDGGYTCDGASLNNASQTDVLMGDISFSAFQARHNQGFFCTEPSGTPTSTPTNTPTPTPLACQQADVMLVLDRSGSINSTELGQLKTAAKDFVDALGLSALGIHAGFTSFATTGSLDHHLSDNSATIKTAVDALVSAGFTNLKDGLDLSQGEHANPGDGHDRVDLTSPDKVIVITDGHPNRPLPSATADDVAKTSADAYRAAGAEIFVVGVGSDVNQAYLETIADDADHYYSVSEYSELETTLQDFDLCE